MTQIALRLPEELLAALDELVPGEHANRSEAVRRAIEQYVRWRANERDAEIYDRLPLSDPELALADDPDAWDATPAW